MNPPPLLAYIADSLQLNEIWHDWFSQGFISWNRDKGVGLTADRPTNGIMAGDRYFDTTLGIPIWYTGTVWVDAAGTTV